ncbi:MAG TPA: glutamate synthase central domain-containing protein, partial [Actinomycetes bacterium]|nr:glutamate synthase central domain-containing protein [Actinomycetes bacterium]
MTDHLPPGTGRTRRALYDRRRDERDACGIGFVADVHGRPSRAILDAALCGLERLRHRGAVAADARTGDGAGVLVPLPEAFFAGPGADGRRGRLGVAMAFLPRHLEEAKEARRLVEQALVAEGLELLRWRLVPVDLAAIGDVARADAPAIEQAVFHVDTDPEDAERRCFRAGRRAALAARAAGVALYLPSCSTRTVTYKALCAADQLAAFYPDLADPAFAVAFAVFHQRYSTNTAPSWERAQPFRFLCHNGEINTLDGNVAWMRAREGHLGAGELDEDLLRPLLDPDGSDSTKLDNAVELLVRGGRDLRHALAMLVPAVEPLPGDDRQDLRDFYRYHACLTEPWDGPAGLVFTDGHLVGAALDRNGLRPMRWEATEDGLVVCASEAGAVDTAGRGRVRRGRLGPGQMLCVDPERGLLTDEQIKDELAASRPWRAWVAEHLRGVDAGRPAEPPADDRRLVAAQATFGFTRELVTTVLRPMATAGKEPTASMGDDTPPAVLGTTTRPVGHFLRQRFAQVTNPPIDHLRERHVLSSRTLLGCRHPLLTEEPEAARMVELAGFTLTPDGLESLHDPALGLCPRVLDATWPAGEGPGGLRAACLRLGDEAVAAVNDGACL